MALVDDFALLYSNHTYKNAYSGSGVTSLNTPRGLARAVNYQNYDSPYAPPANGNVSGIVQYGEPPSISQLDASPPLFIDKYELYKLSENTRHSMIEASYIAKRPLPNSPYWLLGTAGVSQLRVQSVLP